jgi:hypothetical protein
MGAVSWQRYRAQCLSSDFEESRQANVTFFTDWRLVLRRESDSIEAIIHTEGATHVFTEFFVRGTVV